MKISKLQPYYKSAIWGGEKLKANYSKLCDMEKLAESWELSFHESGKSKIDGVDIDKSAKREDLGKNATCFEFFPLLLKFIDAKDELSVQVHPSDEYALKNENSYGKTEAWYIVEADEGAGIYLGFNRDVDKDELDRAIKDENLISLLNFYPVKKGECYFIPSGTLHAIGKGCLILELQQNSDLTYRVYDYGRKDKDGKQRELHVEKAKEVTCMQKFEPVVFENSSKIGKTLAKCKYFDFSMLAVDGRQEIVVDDTSFVCVTVVDGEGKVGREQAVKGDSFFIPADFGNVELVGRMSVVISKI